MKKILFIILILIVSTSLFANGSQETTTPEELPAEAAATGSAMVVAGRLADSVTEQFRSSFITGFLNIHKGVIPALITGLLILEITILGLMMITQNRGAMPNSEICWRIISVFIIIELINLLPWMTSMIGNLFAKAGFIGGSGTSTNQSLQPSMVAEFYDLAIAPLEHYIDSYDTAYESIVSQIDFGISKVGDWLPYWFHLVMLRTGTHLVYSALKFIMQFLFIFVMISFSIAIIELYLLMVVSCFVLPFKLFKPTSFLGEGVFKALFGQGIKIFVMAFVVTASDVIFRSTEVYTWGVAMYQYPSSIWTIMPTVILKSVMFAYLVLRGPEIAKAVIVGQPTMHDSAGEAVKSAGAAMMVMSKFLWNHRPTMPHRGSGGNDFPNINLGGSSSPGIPSPGQSSIAGDTGNNLLGE